MLGKLLLDYVGLRVSLHFSGLILNSSQIVKGSFHPFSTYDDKAAACRRNPWLAFLVYPNDIPLNEYLNLLTQVAVPRSSGRAALQIFYAIKLCKTNDS